MLAPLPERPPRESLQADAMRIVDSVASSHGLKRLNWRRECTVDTMANGTTAAAWRGEDGLWLQVCVPGDTSRQLQVQLNRMGHSWGAQGDSVRLGLVTAFEAHFGSDIVRVGPR